MRLFLGLVGALAAGGAIGACAAISGLSQFSSGDCGGKSCGGSDATTSGEVGSGLDGTSGDDTRLPDGEADGSGDATGCPAGFVLCSDGLCVNPSTINHCGTCDNQCTDAASMCAPEGGTFACTNSCPSSAPVNCNDTCVDTATDPSHCGMCGNACSTDAGHATATCTAGTCTLTCSSGFNPCSGTCVDYTSPANCGGCGHACSAEAGTPVCVASTDGGTDAAAASCVSGCPASKPSLCAGTCVDTTQDARNCGVCGTVCSTGIANATATCAGSACGFVCSSGYTLCNGACVDITSDPNHCGGCSTACSSGLCGAVLAADMSTQPQNWTFNGVAVWDPAGPSARLTTAQTEVVSGTVVYNHPIVTDTFDASFQFRIGANGGGAFDGMGFMIETNGRTALGANAGGLGMEGLNGFGAEFDIYNNGQCGDSNSDHVGVDRLSNCGSGLLTSLFASPSLVGTVNLDDAQWHAALVHLAASAMSVTVDSHAVASGVALTGFVPGTSYYYGFAGAIGGGGGSLGAQTEVKGVTVTFPSPRCL